MIYHDCELLDNCEDGCAHSADGIKSLHAARV